MIPVYVSTLRLAVPASTVPTVHTIRVWPAVHPSPPVLIPTAVVVPAGTEVNVPKATSGGRQSTTDVSCEGGRLLALVAVSA